MKKTLLFTLSLLLVATLSAQKPFYGKNAGNLRDHSARELRTKSENILPALRKVSPVTNTETKYNIAQQNVAEQINSIVVEKWLSATSSYENQSRTLYTYSGNLTTAITSNWNIAGSQWVQSSKSEITSDGAGNTTLMITYSWNSGTSQWIPGMKMESTFDANNNETQYISYLWNVAQSQYVGISKTVYTYDAGGKPLQDLSYSWNTLTSAWDTDSRTEYIWVGNVNTQDIEYVWDSFLPTPAWVNAYKYVYSYNGSGKLTMEMYYSWDEYIAHDWVDMAKYTYAYDASGNPVEYVSYDWDITLPVPDYTPSTKIEVGYDASNREIQFISYNWDAVASEWVGLGKTETSYPPSQSISLNYTYNTTDWELISRTIKSYGTVTRVEKNNESKIRIYPNPASDRLTIDLGTDIENGVITIYDNQGRKVLEKNLSESIQVIPTAKIGKGLHFYSIESEGKVTTGKVVIR